MYKNSSDRPQHEIDFLQSLEERFPTIFRDFIDREGIDFNTKISPEKAKKVADFVAAMAVRTSYDATLQQAFLVVRARASEKFKAGDLAKSPEAVRLEREKAWTMQL